MQPTRALATDEARGRSGGALQIGSSAVYTDEGASEARQEMYRTWMVTMLGAWTIACGATDGASTDAQTDLGSDVLPQGVEHQVEVVADAEAAQDAPSAPDIGADEVAIPPTLGGDRPAALYVPAAYDPTTAWPLVILLHGYGVSGTLQAAYLGLIERVQTFGFVLLTPDGTVDSKGMRYWNASPSCCDFEHTGVDDVAYLRGLIAEARETLHIDAGRVTLLGHSNGGFMAYRMACEAADTITAVATIAGSMSVDVPCTPARPVSVLTVHGTDDDTIGFEGGTIMDAPYLGAEDLAQGWVERSACTSGPEIDAEPFDYDAVAPGAETTRTTWTDCANDTRVAFWTMQGSPHIPPFTKGAKDALVRHLLGL